MSTLWKDRARRVGFHWWRNRRVADMTETDIAEAFDEFAQEYGIHYVWDL